MDEALEIHIRQVVGEILTIAKMPNSVIVVEETDEPDWCRIRVAMPPLSKQGQRRPYFQCKINTVVARALLDKPEAERVTYAAMIRDALTTIRDQLEHDIRHP